MTFKPCLVMTTINPPTDAIRRFSSHPNRANLRIVVAGDLKTPADWSSPTVEFLDLNAQNRLCPEFASALPKGHYSRKNIGYVYALMEGATHVFDTDDDNLPYPEWSLNPDSRLVAEMLGGEGWVNVYSHYADGPIWPRGLPLDCIHKPGVLLPKESVMAPIRQYLADKDPDVDAIFRLLFKGETVFRRRSHPIAIQSGVYVPFNSQNTMFSREAMPLLYLPSFVSFRMTDIWRSFIAQRVGWEKNWNLVYDNASLYQIRNEHNLIKDFELEISGYLQNDKIGRILSSLNLCGMDIGSCMVASYEALVFAGILDAREIPLLRLWLEAVEHAG